MFYKFKTKPFAHQLKALEMSWDKEVYAYFMEMGTGKSKVLIDNVSMLYDKGEINGLLLIAPKGVIKIGTTLKYRYTWLTILKRKLFCGLHHTLNQN